MRLQPYYDGGGPVRLDHPYPWVHLVFVAMAVVFWAVVIYGLVLLINKYAKDHKDEPGKDALSVAKMRYATGEISKEEFEQLKKDLS